MPRTADVKGLTAEQNGIGDLEIPLQAADGEHSQKGAVDPNGTFPKKALMQKESALAEPIMLLMKGNQFIPSALQIDLAGLGHFKGILVGGHAKILLMLVAVKASVKIGRIFDFESTFPFTRGGEGKIINILKAILRFSAQI